MRHKGHSSLHAMLRDACERRLKNASPGASGPAGSLPGSPSSQPCQVGSHRHAGRRPSATCKSTALKPDKRS